MDYAFGSASRSSQYSRFFSSTSFFGTATRLRISTSGSDFVIMTRPFYASTWSVRWDGWTESAPEAPTTIPPRLRRGSSCVPLGDRAIPASGVHLPTSTVASLSTRHDATVSPPAGDDLLLEAFQTRVAEGCGEGVKAVREVGVVTIDAEDVADHAVTRPDGKRPDSVCDGALHEEKRRGFHHRHCRLRGSPRWRHWTFV